MRSIFVPDGYTVTGMIPGTTLYPGVQVKYRPAVPSVRFEYTEANGQGEREKAAKQIVSRQVVHLTVEETPDPIRLSPDDVGKLHAELFRQMFDLVMGFSNPAAVEDAEKN